MRDQPVGGGYFICIRKSFLGIQVVVEVLCRIISQIKNMQINFVIIKIWLSLQKDSLNKAVIKAECNQHILPVVCISISWGEFPTVCGGVIHSFLSIKPNPMKTQQKSLHVSLKGFNLSTPPAVGGLYN